MKETQRQQVPWEHSALTGRFYFGTTPQTVGPNVVAQPQRSEAEAAWAAAKDSTNIAVLEAFSARYKDTFYAELARARIDELKAKASKTASTSVPPSVTGQVVVRAIATIGVIQRSIGRRQSENLVANHGFAIRIRIHDSGVAANQAADLEMAQRAQSIEGLGLYLIERLRQGLLGQGGQRNGGNSHLRRCPRGDHCHRYDVLH